MANSQGMHYMLSLLITCIQPLITWGLFVYFMFVIDGLIFTRSYIFLICDYPAIAYKTQCDLIITWKFHRQAALGHQENKERGPSQYLIVGAHLHVVVHSKNGEGIQIQRHFPSTIWVPSPCHSQIHQQKLANACKQKGSSCKFPS